MVGIDIVVQIIVGIFVIGGGIVGFFVMQKGQNMKIKQLQKEVDEIKVKQVKHEDHRIETEKIIVEINAKLQHIAEAIDELKNKKL